MNHVAVTRGLLWGPHGAHLCGNGSGSHLNSSHNRDILCQSAIRAEERAQGVQVKDGVLAEYSSGDEKEEWNVK